VAWILNCKRCKFGEKICYNSRDIEFFLGDYFFGAPCISTQAYVNLRKFFYTNLENHREYTHKLKLPESRLIGLHLCRWSYGCIFKFSWWAPKVARVLTQSINGPSRSSKVVDFGTNRKCVCYFLLVINSNLGPILPRFRDIAGFLRRATLPLFHPNFMFVPLGLDWRFCGSEERRP